MSNDITCTEDDANDLSLGRSASDGEAEAVAGARDQCDLAAQIEESMGHGNASPFECMHLYLGNRSHHWPSVKGKIDRVFRTSSRGTPLSMSEIQIPGNSEKEL